MTHRLFQDFIGDIREYFLFIPLISIMNIVDKIEMKKSSDGL